MKFDELLRQVPEDGVFRVGQLLAASRGVDDIRRQLDRWVKAGRVLRLRRGVYMLAAPYARQSAHPFRIANALKRASYVSLQSALSHYGMIPEYVPVVTSVTTRRPETVETALGRFQYRHVKPCLLNGFSDMEIAPGQSALLASPEKALIDLLYLTPRSDDSAFLDELRVMPPAGGGHALKRVAERLGSAKVIRAVKRLEAIWQEGADT